MNYAMYCLLPTGRAQEAADHYAIALKEDPLNLRWPPWFKPMVGLLAAVLTRNGETGRAEMLRREHLSPERESVDPVGPAVFHLVNGDVDSMADWVENAIEERQFAVFFFLSSHGQALRASPRWPAVARMLNLPE